MVRRKKRVDFLWSRCCGCQNYKKNSPETKISKRYHRDRVKTCTLAYVFFRYRNNSSLGGTANDFKCRQGIYLGFNGCAHLRQDWNRAAERKPLSPTKVPGNG